MIKRYILNKHFLKINTLKLFTLFNCRFFLYSITLYIFFILPCFILYSLKLSTFYIRLCNTETSITLTFHGKFLYYILFYTLCSWNRCTSLLVYKFYHCQALCVILNLYFCSYREWWYCIIIYKEIFYEYFLQTHYKYFQ